MLKDPVTWALAIALFTWAIVFYRLGALRHDRFATYSFDLGIYDQGAWLLSRFKSPFVTVKGLNLFGHHLNAIMVLFAPFYWLGAGPKFLLAVQVAAQASGAIAIYLLARDRLGERWLGVVMAIALLLNPTYQFLVWEFFHPDALAMAPVLFAYWAASSQRWRWFALAAVLAVACKEDAALVIGGMGLLFWFRGERRAGLITAASAFGWFVLSTRGLMRLALGGLNPFYDGYFGDLGSNVGEVVRSIFTRPGKVLGLIFKADRLEYYRLMFAPVGFLAVGALPTLLLVAGPMLAVNALTSFPYARDFKYHYSALVVAGIVIATVEAIARIGINRTVRRALVVVVGGASLLASMAWGLSPIGDEYRTGYWPLAADPRNPIKTEAVNMVPGNAAVAASYQFGPHLTHRERMYDFPEPWKAVNWGIRGENLHDPAVVEWIVLDRRLFNDFDRELVGGLLASGEFEVRLDRDDILVAERARPSAPG